MPFNFFKKNKEQYTEPMPGSDLMQNNEAPVQLPVDSDRLRKWNDELRKYKDGKRSIEARIRRNEEFWKMRQWKAVTREAWDTETPSTAWLFNCIQSKHADIMDSYPTANFRPRQRDDVAEARKLSAIVPVILTQNNFQRVYSETSEYTLKNGTGVYHVWWDGSKHGGLGDVSIKKVGIFNIFWEPGITNIQDSTYVFKVELVNNELLRQRYPQLKDHGGKQAVDIAEYIIDERVDRTGKTPVIDVYYHTEIGGARLLHYCKYVGETVIFASENEGAYAARGWYDHGLYPFVVQPLYHVEESLYGMGMVDVGAPTQMQIDLLNEAITKNTLMGSQPRCFATKTSGINMDDFCNWRQSVVECNSLGETATMPIETTPLQGNYLEFYQSKIEELKFTTSNHDTNNGSAPSGITAASAIAALQETAGKNTRFINKTFYNAYKEIVSQVVELIRQFYDVPRTFRIAPDALGEEFVKFDNSGIKAQPLSPNMAGQNMGIRIPEFDIDISAEKANPYKKMEINELAVSFFKLGFFNPQLCDQALATLDMMDFDSKQAIIDRIKENKTLSDRLMQYMQLAFGLAQKYDPQAAMMIQADMMGSGQPIPSSGGVSAEKVAEPVGSGETKQVKNARERARSSTETEG